MRKILTLLLLATLASCSRGEGRASCPVGQRCLEVGNAYDPQTLDPGKVQLVTDSNILYDLMIGLVQWDAKGNVIPGMATAWEESADGLIWTFHLRDARWSDGVPVTADDFVYAFHRLENPATASPYAYYAYFIAGAQAVNEGRAALESMGVHALGPHTLQLRLIHPVPYLPLMLINPSLMPLPAHVVRRWGDAWSEPAHYVSNGPYTLKDWKLGEPATLTRNKAFWDNAQTCFDQLRYYPISDMVTGERRVASGELDINYAFSSTRIPYIRKHLPGYIHMHAVPASYYLVFNLHDHALQDKRVRLALSMDVDRDFITDTLGHGQMRSLYNFVPPGMANYTDNAPPPWAHWPFARREAAARQLLAQAGYGPAHPLRLELKYDIGSGSALVAMQADWRKIGVDMSLAPEEGQVEFSDLNAGDFQVGFASWMMDYDDPTTFLNLAKSDAGPQNYGHYSNPRYDALMSQADRQRDLVKRASIMQEAEALFLADVPVVPIATGTVRYLVHPAITGWVDHANYYFPKRYLCRKGAPPL